MLIVRILFILCIQVFISSNAFACASCGSGGGAGSLYLTPLQKYQVLLGSRINLAGDNVLFDGSRAENIDVDQIYNLDFAGAVRVTSRMSIGLNASAQHNMAAKTSETGFSDPSISSRYTLYRQAISRPYVPQLQLNFAYKHNFSKPLYDSTEAGAVDIFGAGNKTVSLGYDLWNGLHSLQLGLAQTFTYSLEHEEGDNKIQAGPLLSSVLSVGYQMSRYKWTLGYSNGYRFAPKKLNGSDIKDSTSLTHGGFLSFDWRFYKSFKVRANVAQTIPYGAFMSQDRTSVSLALLYSGI